MNVLLFLYFFTLHADQLSFNFKGVTVRWNNLIALFLGLSFIIHFRIHAISLNKGIVKALSALFFSLLLSLAFSLFKMRCALFLGWFGFTILFYFLLPFFLTLFFDEKKIFRLYFLSFLCVGCYALFQCILSFFNIMDPFAAQILKQHVVRPSAFAYEPAYLALYLTPFVMFSNLYYLLRRKKERYVFKTLSLKYIVFVNAIYVITTSASVFFAYLIFLTFLLFLPSKNTLIHPWKKAVFRCAVGFISLSSLLFFLFPRFSHLFLMKFFVKNFQSHHSIVERWQGIVAAWETFKETPFFGCGFGAYPPYFFQMWLEEKRGFLKPKILEGGSFSLKSFEASNVSTEILASLGVVGLLVSLYFLKLYFQKGVEAVRDLKMAPERGDFAFALLVSTVVTLIVWQFNQGILRTYIWTHLAITWAFFLKAPFFNMESSTYQKVI